MINVTSNTAQDILDQLGTDPSPQDLKAYAQENLGLMQIAAIPAQDEMLDYIVTLKNYECQANFYDEMESPGSRGSVPERAVECTNRMPMCRSTHYSMTGSEADRLRSDPRVAAVEISPESRGIRVQPLNYQFSSNWDKSSSVTSNMKNWGLLRQWNRAQLSNWGSNGTANRSGAITTTSQGYNVDCVVFDGNLLVDHPEYAVNSDGTGGSRVIQLNWFQWNPQVTGDPPGVYNYGAGTVANNGHGIHVGGTMCGNTQGWARSANIYNISPYGDQSNGTRNPSIVDMVNYIRYWHNNIKTVNPATGVKNPTVVNMSFGYGGNAFPFNAGQVVIDQLFYQPTNTTTNYPASPPSGQTALQATYNGRWNITTWYNAGVQMFKEYADLYGVILFFFTTQNAALDAAIMDGANEGIIWVAAAGNQWNEAGFVNTSNRYNNYLRNGPFATFFHNRLGSPANAHTGTFGTPAYRQIGVVGNIGPTVNEQLSITTSAGSKLTAWAPGENIMSSYNSGVPDPRNAAYFLQKLTGTSMASPQISGILGCVAEQYPTMNQQLANRWMSYYSQKNIIPDLAGPYPPGPVQYYGLRQAPNEFGLYYNDRPIDGSTWPQQRSWIRPTTGAVYPRAARQYRQIS